MSAFRWAVVALGLSICSVNAQEKPGAWTNLPVDPLPKGALVRLGTARFQTYSHSVAFSPDGKRIITGNCGNTVFVWDTTTGREVLRFEEGKLGRDVWRVTLSPDGKLAATLDPDNGVLLWNAHTGKFLRGTGGSGELQRHEIYTFAFSPRSDTLYLRARDRTRVIRVADGKDADPPVPPEKGLTIDLMSPDGATAGSIAEGGRFVIWDIASGKKLGEFACGEKFFPAAIAPGGERIAMTTKKDSVVIHDLTSKKEVCQCEGHQWSLLSVMFSPDGKSLVTGSCDLTTKMWDSNTGKERWSHPDFNVYRTPLAFSPNGDVVGLIGSDGIARLLDVFTGKERAHAPYTRWFGVNPLAVTPDGKWAYSAGDRAAISRWDLSTGEAIVIREATAIDRFDPVTRRVIHANAYISRIRVRPDGASLLLSGNNGVELLDIRNPARPQAEKITDEAEGCLTPDGKTLAVLDRKFKLVDVASKKIINEVPNPLPWGYASFSPDGRMIAISGQEATVQLVDARTLRRTAVLHDRGVRSISSVEFSPDGQLLASTGGDLQVDIWEIASGKLRQIIFRPGCLMSAVAFSPDGRYLAYGGSDQIVCIRDLTTDKDVHSFRGHNGDVSALTFTPDGRRLISSSSDGTALVWDMKAVLVSEPKYVDRTAKELRTLWEQLGGEPRAAAEAMRELRRTPSQAVELIGGHVKPADKARLAKLMLLVRDLDSDVLVERDRATAALQEVGEEAVEPLRAALADEPTPEMERRANALLTRLEGKPSPERLRALRAVQVLEWIGTPAARKALEVLAAGVSEAELTRTAAAALGCLDKR